MEFKLSELLGSAGAAVGLIIAGSIFLQCTSSRFNDLLLRFRSSTDEYRANHASDSRRPPLQAQIRMVRLRLRLMAWASWMAIGAILGLLVAMLCGGGEFLWHDNQLLKGIGAVGLALELVLIGTAAIVHLLESVFGRHEIDDESEDLDERMKA